MCMRSCAPTCCQFTQPKTTRVRQTQKKKRVCSPAWVTGSCGRTAVLSHSYSFIHPVPRPHQLPSLLQHPQQQPSTHPPPPWASLCAHREALLSSHACLLFPPGPPLPWFSLLTEQQTVVVFGTQLNKHTHRVGAGRGGWRTHLTPSWLPWNLLSPHLTASSCVLCSRTCNLVILGYIWRVLQIMIT